MRVGYPSHNYQYRRLIVGAVPDVEYKEVPDSRVALATLARVVNRLAKRSWFTTTDLESVFTDLGGRGVDLLHLNNAINYGSTPWVATFETVIPRFSILLSCHHGPEPGYSRLRGNPEIRKALAAISGRACRRILAMSRCSAAIQEDLLREFPEYSEDTMGKLTVIHPAQRSLVSRYSDKGVDIEGELTFTIVGSSFFRKGGVEVIETLGRLRRDYGYAIRLAIVSSLAPDNYAIPTGPLDVRRVQHYISETTHWIDYYPRLPNPEVLALMKRSHVGLLPSYAETYGYSALEFQASGCPVISTNVRALPEINDASRGWIIQVPKNRLGEAIYTTEEQRSAVGTAIREGLATSVHEVFADRESIVRKAESAIAYVAQEHSVDAYAQKMRDVYSTALQE